jgi:hypothetical protein
MDGPATRRIDSRDEMVSAHAALTAATDEPIALLRSVAPVLVEFNEKPSPEPQAEPFTRNAKSLPQQGTQKELFWAL